MTAALQPEPAPAWRSASWPWFVLLAVLGIVLVVGAMAPRDPATTTEQVADIASGIRCPTCSGESAAVSDADVSKQIRLDVAQRLQQGQTPDQIRAFYADRYGDSILLTPQGSGVAGLVWVLPVAGVVVAASGLVFVFRRWNRGAVAHATDADRLLVERAMHDADVGDGDVDGADPPLDDGDVDDG